MTTLRQMSSDLTSLSTDGASLIREMRLTSLYPAANRPTTDALTLSGSAIDLCMVGLIHLVEVRFKAALQSSLMAREDLRDLEVSRYLSHRSDGGQMALRSFTSQARDQPPRAGLCSSGRSCDLEP